MASIKILEKGHCFFLYKPKVNVQTVKSMSDVAKMHLLTIPEKITDKNLARVFILPKKRLPSITHTHYDVNFALIDKVSNDVDVIRKEVLEGKTYETPSTHQKRELEPDRLVGEGVYMIDYNEERKSSHFSYMLELPHQIGHVQNAMNVDKQGSFAITLKNPKYEHQGRISSAEFPSHIQRSFRNRKFMPLEDIEALNTNRAEILMIGATSRIVDELHEFTRELGKMKDSRITTDDAMEQVHLSEAEHPTDPIDKGKFA